MFLLFIVFVLTQATTEVFSSLDPDLPQHCLGAHNDYRGRHKSPKLTWSSELAEQAQNWANHLAAIDQMERDPGAKEGENIFFMYGGDPAEACDRAVENWYSEVRNYDFKNPHESPSTDHFSQIVWKNTKELGVGSALSKSGNFFLVARYKPSGNTGGAFRDNVESASDVKVDPSESTPQTTTEKAKETSTKPTTPTVPISTSEAMVTKTSTTSNSGGSNFALPEPIYEDEINNSKNEPPKDEEQDSAKQLDSSHGDAETKLEKLDKDKSSASPGADMLMTPPKYGKDYQIDIRFPDIEYTNKMSYSSSREFRNMKLAITSEILQMFEDCEEFLEVQLLSLRNGSVIATVGMIFSKPGHNYLDRLTQSVAAGKLGDMVVSRDYVKADVVPDGYLRLTLPHQPPLFEQCPQPCSNPTHCFQTGCNVDCCSFHPSSPSSESALVQQSTPPICPGNCPSTCYPQCTNECCSDKMVAQTEAPRVSHMTSTASPVIDYSQCQASCPITCIPECTPECCFAPSTQECDNDCADVCSTECPQECCTKKSRVHSRHFGHTTLGSYHHLPPLNHGTSPQSAFMYGPKYRALRNPIRHAPKAPSPGIHRRQGYTSNIPASYWKPYLKLAASYGYGTNDGTLRNTVVPKKKISYTHQIKAPTQPQKKVPYNRQPNQNLQTRDQRVQSSYGTHPRRGMTFIKDLKSKGAPVNVRYAYRYGDRLLVPIDLPKSMDIKEMKGKKFISVPAFKRGNVARNLQKRKTL